MKYSISQDPDTEMWCVYDSDTGEKLSEWDSRRAASREMGRLEREEGKDDKDKKEEKSESKKKQADEGEHEYR
jgi:hypothetical protein